MTVLAVGGEADCFELLNGSYLWDTTGGRFNANACRGALKAVPTTGQYNLRFGSSQTDFWVHFDLYMETPTATSELITLVNSGASAFAIGVETGGEWTASVYESGFQDLATSADVVLSGARATFDIHIVIDDTVGEFTIYKDGVEVLTFSGDTLRDTSGANELWINGQAGGSNECFFSQVIVADEDTRGWVLATHNAASAGTTTQWTEGDYSDIDEEGYDEADYIATNTNDHVDTFVAANINAAFTLYSVKAVAVAVAGAVDADATPNDIQAVIRSDGVDYPSASLGFTNDGSSQVKQVIYDEDPDTSSAWAQAAVNAMEFGVKAVA